MLRVTINHARSGMKLALPVLNPRRGNVLLNEGYVLDESMIRKLRRLEVREFWIDYPGSEVIQQFVSPTMLQAQGRVVSVMADLFESVQDQQSHVKLDFADYRRMLRELIEEMAIDRAACAYIAEFGGDSHSTLRHSAEVCFLSAMLGLNLQDYLVKQRPRLRPADAKNVISLALGAMLHDIGYLKLDPAVRERFERTRNENDPEWQQHVVLGHRFISGSTRPSAAGVVLQHHQHYDGSGFPREIDADGRYRGLMGEEIHVFARIVCVANHFDRLRHPGDGIVLPRVTALRKMLFTPLSARFDPVVLAELPRVVPAYAPGAVITLSNGESAMVVDWDKDDPCRPVVRVRESADSATGPIIDLREHRTLCVVEQDGFDVRRENFSLSESGWVLSAAA